MPVTPFQREILGVIAANRTEDSHFPGGLVLNANAASARFSKDFDIFHEAAGEVARASDADVAKLRAAGFASRLEPSSPRTHGCGQPWPSRTPRRLRKK